MSTESNDQYLAGFEAAMTKLGHPIRFNADGSYAGMNSYRFEGYVGAQGGVGEAEETCEGSPHISGGKE